MLNWFLRLTRPVFIPGRAGGLSLTLALAISVPASEELRPTPVPVLRSATINFEAIANRAAATGISLESTSLDNFKSVPEVAPARNGLLPIIPDLLPSDNFLALLDSGEPYAPDVAAAVGPNHLMAIFGTNLQIQLRNGQVVSRVSLISSNGFWGSLGNVDSYNPRLTYDPYGKRWILVTAGGLSAVNAGIFVGVSETSDPTGNWHQHYMQVNDTRQVFADTPAVGFNKDWIAVQANMFGLADGAFVGSYVYAINKTNLYAGGTGQPHRFELIDPPDEYNYGWSQMPAITYDPNIEAVYFVQSYLGEDIDGYGRLRIFLLGGALGAPVFQPGVFVLSSATWDSYPPEATPNFAPQKGSSRGIYPGSDDMQSVFMRANTLYAAHTVYLPKGGNPTRSVVQYWTMTTGGIVYEQTRVDSNPNTQNHYSFPSIAVNRHNDIAIGLSQFSSTNYPSAALVYSPGTSSNNVYQSRKIFKAGQAPFNAPDWSGRNRWGNYSATMVDPVNETEFWTLQEYAAQPVGTNTGRRGCWWARLSPYVDLSVNIKESSDPVAAGSELTYTLLVYNFFPVRASEVFVTNQLPANTTFVSATTTNGSCFMTNGTVICDLGMVLPSEQRAMTVKVIPQTAGVIRTSATISSRSPEASPIDNSHSITTTVQVPADLSLTVMPSANVVNPTEELAFTLSITNLGMANANSVILTNALPSKAQYLSASSSQGACYQSGSTISCSLGNLNSGQSASVTIHLQTTSSGMITNRAGVRSSTIDGNTNNNSVTLITRVNASPTISTIGDQTISEGGTLGPLPLTIGDPDRPASDLVLTGFSSNTGLAPNANIVFGGSGSNRTITVTPLAGQFGATIISALVRDADGLSATNSFVLNVGAVNDPPWISDIPDQSINESAVTPVLGFTIGDPETAAANLVVTAVSTNLVLAPISNIIIDGNGTNRTIQVSPVAGQSGVTLITVTVSDGQHAASDDFLLTVNVTNRAPTISPISDRAVNEDGSTGNIAFSVGDAETSAENLVVTATSDNPTLIPQNWFFLGGSGSNRTVNIVPGSNQHGTARVTITVTDEANAATNRTFTLTVFAVNDPPTLDGISDLTISENAGPQTVILSGISSGASNEIQTLVVTAASTNLALIPNPVVNYTSPNSSGSLSFTPAPNQTGQAEITVTVLDGGATTNSITQVFRVTVLPANLPPTLGAIEDITLMEDAPEQWIDLANITSGSANENQVLTVTAASSHPHIMPHPAVDYQTPNSTGRLRLAPLTNQFGTVTITVTVSDDGASNNVVSRAFSVSISPVNDFPTLDPIPNILFNEDADLQVVQLQGITSGATNEVQTLTVTATSSRPDLIPHPQVLYTSPNTSGLIGLAPAPNAVGEVQISVTVNDQAGTNNLLTRQFTATLIPVNDAPSISSIADQSINEDNTIELLSFTIGDVESDANSLTVGVTFSNPQLLGNQSLLLTGSGSSRTLRITPITNQFGASQITLIVRDPAGASNSTSFNLTVAPVNDMPIITSISNQTLNPNAILGPLAFEVSDLETSSDELRLWPLSSNPELIHATNIVLGGAASNRTITVRPFSNRAGTAAISLYVLDAEGGFDFTSFDLTVVAANQMPAITGPPDQIIDEDTTLGPLTFAISDLETPPGELILWPLCSNPDLIDTTRILLGGSGTNRSLTIQPRANQSGAATISLYVFDTEGGFDFTTFDLTVLPVNDAPTLDALINLDLAEDAPEQTVVLSGLGSGAANEIQTLVITATSSHPEVIPPPGVTYTEPAATGSLRFTPVPNASGTATITVTVNDGGASNNVASRTFDVTVAPVNDPPTLTSVPGQTLLEDGATAHLAVTVGDVETAATALVLTATAGHASLVSAAGLELGGNGSNRTVRITPLGDQHGSSTITLYVADGDGATNTTSFELTVLPVNDPPTLDALTNLDLAEDAPEQTVALSGLGSGAANEIQTLVITATSSHPEVIPPPGVTYTEPAATGSLRFTPVANASGTATITVTVNDGGASNNLASRTFDVTVAPVNDPPTLDPIPNIANLNYAGPVVVQMTGIGAGSADELQALTVVATSDNPSFISNPEVTYAHPDSTGVLTLLVPANITGTARFTVTVDDGGAENTSFSRVFSLTVDTALSAPWLSVERSGPSVVVTWPYPAAGYDLETSSDLPAPGWQKITTNSTVNGAIQYVTLPLSQTAQFFRLSPDF